MTKKAGDRNKNFTLTSEKLQMFEMAVWKSKNLDRDNEALLGWPSARGAIAMF